MPWLVRPKQGRDGYVPQDKSLQRRWVLRPNCRYSPRTEQHKWRICVSLLTRETPPDKLTKLNLTRLKTLRERSVNVSKQWRFDVIRMNDALEMATSPIISVSRVYGWEEHAYVLPEPIAIPTSAAVRA